MHFLDLVGREHPALVLEGPAAPVHRQHGHQGRGEGARHAREHGGPKRHVWRKLHLGIDEETLKAHAAETSLARATGSKQPVDGSHIDDAPVLPDLRARSL